MSSTIGRIPSTAAPMPSPMNAVSEIGVSSTRSGPNRSSSPAVELKMPPYFPTSSPRTTTAGSRSISWAMPSTMARAVVSRRIVGWAGMVADSVTLICCSLRENVLVRRLRRRLRAALGELDGPFDAGGRLRLHVAELVLVENSELPQEPRVRGDRVPARHLGEVGSVALRIALEMTPQPQGVHLEQGRPLADTGAGHRLAGRGV